MTTKPKKKTPAKPAKMLAIPMIAEEVARRVVELEAKFNALADQLDAYIIAGNKTLVDHGNRLIDLVQLANSHESSIVDQAGLIAWNRTKLEQLETVLPTRFNNVENAAVNATTREALEVRIRELIVEEIEAARKRNPVAR